MKKMKKMISVKHFQLLVFLLSTMLIMPSCSKEDDIIGTWYGYFPYDGPVTFTFNADGSYTEIYDNKYTYFGNYTYNEDSSYLMLTFLEDGYYYTEIYKAAFSDKTLILCELDGTPFISLTKK